MKIIKTHPVPWRVVRDEEIYFDYKDEKLKRKYMPEDTCIVDKNNVEVIGCSEWMRGSEDFQYICDCVNKNNGY